MSNQVPKQGLPAIFFDIGHEFGAMAGAEGNGIQEGPYNLGILHRVMELWAARVTIDDFFSRLPKVLETLESLQLYVSSPYLLVVSNMETDFLCGKYAERLEEARELGIDFHIQIHLNSNAGVPGKYTVVGYNSDNTPYVEKSEKMGNIMLDCLEEAFGDMVKNTKLKACSRYSDLQDEKNIAYCLRHSPCPAILVEPLFLNNPEHASFLKSDSGKERLVNAYLKAMERIATEVI